MLDVLLWAVRTVRWTVGCIVHRKLTWNMKIIFIFLTFIFWDMFEFHATFRVCIYESTKGSERGRTLYLKPKLRKGSQDRRLHAIVGMV